MNALFIENKRKQFRYVHPFDTYAIIKNINVIYSIMTLIFLFYNFEFGISPRFSRPMYSQANEIIDYTYSVMIFQINLYILFPFH